MKATAWSYSRLNEFETCPKKFWHMRIAKDYAEDGESEAQTYGKSVHKAFELRVVKHTPLPSNLKHYESIVGKLAAAHGTKLAEQQLAIDESFRPVKWFDKNVWCRAVVDLAIVSEPHAVTIDYKTGKMDPDFTQQRLATSLLMLHHRAIKTAETLYLWLKNKKITKEWMNRDDMRSVWVDLLPRVKRYQIAFEKSEFPARQNGLCRKHCPVTSCIYNGANS